MEDNVRTDLKVYWNETSGSGQSPVAGSCKHGNSPLVSIIVDFFDQLGFIHLLKTDPVPRNYLINYNIVRAVIAQSV
jgi:hypothetical protein